MKDAKKNVLILGGAGFLGANLARYALKQGAMVTVFDSLDPRLKSTTDSIKSILPKISFVQGDIRDSKAIEEIMGNADIIFNLAAQTSHPNSIDDPFFDADINVRGTLTVLRAVKDINPEARVIYASSSTLVGKAEKEVVDEDHPEHPLDIYSANKGVAEKYHYIFHNRFDLLTTSLRFANLYGPYGKNDPAFGFMNYFIGQAMEGKPITVYGTGEQLRNVMYGEDACEILWMSATREELIGKTLFAAHPEHYSIKKIAESIAETFDTKVTYMPWPEYRKKIDIDSVEISSKRLYDLTGWQPKFSLSEGLKTTKERIQHEK